MAIWVVSMSWLLYIVLLWMLGVQVYFQIRVFIFPDKYLGMEMMLNHMVSLFLDF